MFVLSTVLDQDAVVDQVPDVQRSWIKKLFGFTVLKPTERSSYAYHYNLFVQLAFRSLFGNKCVFWLCLLVMVIWSVAGSQGTNPSIWRHCLSRKSRRPSHNLSAGSLVSFENNKEHLRSSVLDIYCVKSQRSHSSRTFLPYCL